MDSSPALQMKALKCLSDVTTNELTGCFPISIASSHKMALCKLQLLTKIKEARYLNL